MKGEKVKSKMENIMKKQGNKRNNINSASCNNNNINNTCNSKY